MNGVTIKSKERFQFKWDTLTNDIILLPKNVAGSIKSTDKEKEILMDFILNVLGGGG